MKGLPKDNSGCKVTKADAWLKEAEAREWFYEGLKLHKEDLPYFIRRLIRERIVDAEDVKFIITLENKEDKG